MNIILNRPRQSTDNGIVERDHGVRARWLEPDKAATYHALQHQMTAAIQMQRDRYPGVAGTSRLQAFPALNHDPRPYAPDHELEQWSWQRVANTLSQRVWQRRVDKVGRVSFFSSDYSIGRAWAGHCIHVRLDAECNTWVFETEQGQRLKRYPNTNVTPATIHALTISKRSNKTSSHAS